MQQLRNVQKHVGLALSWQSTEVLSSYTTMHLLTDAALYAVVYCPCVGDTYDIWGTVHIEVLQAKITLILLLQAI